MSLARIQEEDILDFEKLVMSKDDCFDLNGSMDQSIDLLNKAFSFLIIPKSDKSGNSDSKSGKSGNSV